MNKNIFLLALIAIFYTSLNAQKLYINVGSIHRSNLFNTVYNLNELGYKAYTNEYGNHYEVYIGPFIKMKDAESTLTIIKKKIAITAYIFNNEEAKTKNTIEKKTLPLTLKSEMTLLKTVDAIELGIQTYYYNNTFEKDGQYSFSLEGYKYGLSLRGTKTINDFLYISGDVRYIFSNIRFKDNTEDEGKVPETMYEVRILSGIEFSMNNYLISPYLGLGYRTINNDFKNIDASHHKQKYKYIPIGIIHRFVLNNTTRISTQVEYDYFISGEVTNDNATYQQNNAYGLHIQSAYEKKEWSVGLFSTYTDIEKSEVNHYPNSTYIDWIKKNHTLELGLEIKYHFTSF